MERFMSAPEMLPISYLNAYAYCPRRFYYEFTLAEMLVNEHVLEGQQLHDYVDTPGSRTREEKTQIRHLYLCAPCIGLVGYCDLLETGIASSDLSVLASMGQMFPVEYKKGRAGRWISDHTQLCAQALALEEVLEVEEGSISHGYVFYIGSARREAVMLDAALRAHTQNVISEARHLALANTPPAPIHNWKKCRDCSLEPLCLPREVIALQTGKGDDSNGDTLFN